MHFQQFQALTIPYNMTYIKAFLVRRFCSPIHFFEFIRKGLSHDVNLQIILLNVQIAEKRAGRGSLVSYCFEIKQKSPNKRKQSILC